MKALVLAGGSGSRLRPITHTYAKQLLPVANKPVLFYGLEAIRDAGITDVGMVVGDTAPAIEEAVGDGSRLRAHRHLPPAGRAAAAWPTRSLIARTSSPTTTSSCTSGTTSSWAGSPPGGGVPLQPAGRPDHADQVPDPRQFGVAELDDAGEVVGLEEKPQHPKSDLALVGVYIFTPAVHEAVRSLAAVVAGRTGDHRGHPVAHRPAAARCGPPRSPGTGRTPATWRTCSRSTGWCWRPSSRRCGARSSALRAHRPGGRSRTAPR